MANSNKTSNKSKTTTSVIDDYVDQSNSTQKALDDMEVVADNIDIANTSVSDVAVVKLPSDTESDTDNDEQSQSFNKFDDKNLNKGLDTKVAQKFDKISDDTSSNDDSDDSKDSKIDDIKETAQDVKETAWDKIDELTKSIGSAVGFDDKDDDTNTPTAQQIAKETAQDVKETAQDVKETAQQVAQDVKETAWDKIDELTKSIGSVVGFDDKDDDTNTPTAQQVAKETAQNKIDELAKQLGAVVNTDEPDDLDVSDGDGLNDDKEDKDDKKDGQKKVDNQVDAKQNHSTTNPSDYYDVGGISGLLTKAGAYLGRNYQDKNYQGVDLHDSTTTKHPFYIQSSTLGGSFVKSIFGKKVTVAHHLADKFISDDKLNAISQSVYEKIAELARAWALRTLPVDPKTLSSTQKDELAQSLANQNRALATAGGVTGFFGLTGVVMDTAWLLLVALRTVYQLSAVYGVPLTKKEGIKMAYSVLSGADLDKMQEKQIILTALALAKKTLVYAGENGLKEELIKLSSSNINIDDFDGLLKFTHLDKLVEKYGIDINGLNTHWSHRLVAVSAVGVAAHYNHRLIDEIIGTAMATFKADEMLSVEYQGNESGE
ncbi:EcsC family protein [Moraxella nonliquefaciens]|uniref:EcsC family protein n=1 Tax=Moraxella nonliquefaciens TaxID=478 RepID=UPI001EF5BD60|nr:EcsC family protein [Moraxella nonliquefaciens]MCG7412767.1 EcsC family protein [Moraxella nonliquefaciens]